LGLYNAYHQPTTCKTKKPTMHLGPLQRLPPTNNLPYQKTNQASWAFTMPTTNQQPAKPKKTFILGLYNSYQPTTYKTKKPTRHLGPLQFLPPTNNLLNQKTNQASWAFTMPTTNQQPAKPKNQPRILGLYNAYHQLTTC
jgi:ABC-type uncharacterized transport system substrate-binding protein